LHSKIQRLIVRCPGRALQSQQRAVFYRMVIMGSLLLGAACSASKTQETVAPTAEPLPLNTQTQTRMPSLTATSSATATATATSTPTPSKTATATSTFTPTFTPEPLPLFTSRILLQDVTPQTYLDNTCDYLRLLWSPEGSSPGTVVVPVMFHSIVKSGRAVNDPKDISEEQFQAFVYYAQSLGFQTITSQQLLGFLQNNARIPPRSMILIVDDRRPGVVRDHFLPVLETNHWTLTLAYIADPNSFQWAMKEIETMNETGLLDVQSHGYSGQLYIVDQSAESDIRSEILNSTPVLEEHFGKRPIAFIWPGGNFSSLAVQIAREGGYQLGFTAYSRGPVMFNWIPQGEEEAAINDPMMLLPRAWSNSVNYNLFQAVQVSDQARDQAASSYDQEAQYFRTYCAGELPPLESILPPTPKP
jgi:peptidoglycan/xylan/chitin deacetylase (PgdA/CDA1 family)